MHLEVLKFRNFIRDAQTVFKMNYSLKTNVNEQFYVMWFMTGLGEEEILTTKIFNDFEYFK